MRQFLPSKLQTAVGQPRTGFGKKNVQPKELQQHNSFGRSKFAAAVASDQHVQNGGSNNDTATNYLGAGIPPLQTSFPFQAQPQQNFNALQQQQQQQPYHVPISNIPNQACYVHHQVSVEQIVEEENRVSVEGLLHFFWVQDAVDSKTNELMVDPVTRQNIRGAELLYHLQQHRGFSIESKVASRVVVLKPLNDEKCCMPIPTRRNTPLALFQGMNGEVTVDRILFYPDIGIVHLAYKFSGWLTQPMPSFRFPFDRHAIKLEIVTRDNPPTSIFDPVGNGVGMRIVVAPPASIVTFFHFLLDESQTKLASPVDVRVGTRVMEGWRLGPDPRHLQCLDFSRGGDCPLPTLVIPLERQNGALLCRTMTPTYLFVMISLVSFAMSSQSLFQRSTIALISLASVLLLRFALSNSLPKFSSVTLLDYYFIGTYITLALVEVLNLVAYEAAAGSSSTEKGESEVSFDAGAAAAIGVFWSLFHVGVLLLRDSPLLRGNWDYIVTKSKLRRSIGSDAARVFPMRISATGKGSNVDSREPIRQTAMTAVLRDEITKGYSPKMEEKLPIQQHGNIIDRHDSRRNMEKALDDAEYGDYSATRKKQPSALQRIQSNLTSNGRQQIQKPQIAASPTRIKKKRSNNSIGSPPVKKTSSQALTRGQALTSSTNPLVESMKDSSRTILSAGVIERGANTLEAIASSETSVRGRTTPRSRQGVQSQSSGKSSLEEIARNSP